MILCEWDAPEGHPGQCCVHLYARILSTSFTSVSIFSVCCYSSVSISVPPPPQMEWALGKLLPVTQGEERVREVRYVNVLAWLTEMGGGGGEGRWSQIREGALSEAFCQSSCYEGVETSKPLSLFQEIAVTCRTFLW
jgi:hypothetical protein